jgi:L-aspartate oxidase
MSINMIDRMQPQALGDTTMNAPPDVVVIGCGLAGLAVALSLADTCRVAILGKQSAADGASVKAQGGIAAVLAADDDCDQHVADTLLAGAGLCDEKAASYIVGQGPASIAWLISQGVRFTRDESGATYHLTREGGHTRRRIVHAADATGHEVHGALLQRARAHPNVALLENRIAIDLITSVRPGHHATRCDGLHVLDTASGCVMAMPAAHTVLATGGAGTLYQHTSNPPTATGDGIGMAWRAGCSVANLEFIQFHPTCLYHPSADSFLISEALRGEGAVLRLPQSAGGAAGPRFMQHHDPRAELAPRDIVARAIEHEMKTRGLDCVYLDITARPAALVRHQFPTIYERCLALGIDITCDPIPVVPAAHYMCGGVVTGAAGRTELDGLYAVGEVACTGLHGANRLASNSLLECIAMGRAAAQDILHRPGSTRPTLPPWREKGDTSDVEPAAIAKCRDSLRRTMWRHVGIVRTTEGLQSAQEQIQRLGREAETLADHAILSAELLELRNMLEVASLIVESALSRRESRGAHFNRDYPQTASAALPTVLTPESPRSQRSAGRRTPRREPSAERPQMEVL